MWIAKFQNKHEDCVLSPKCIKYKVTDLVYLLNYWIEKDKFYYTELHLLQGTEENKKKFTKELKRDKSAIRIEIFGDYVTTLNIRKEEIYSPAFDPKIIRNKPVVQRADGWEDWELACWDKAVLTKVLQIPTFRIKNLSIRNLPLKDIFLPKIYPKLSLKQKEALELAVKEGYYNFPRKLDLEDLAKIAKVKRQTYMENLRRAENKLIPFLTENKT